MRVVQSLQFILSRTPSYVKGSLACLMTAGLMLSAPSAQASKTAPSLRLSQSTYQSNICSIVYETYDRAERNCPIGVSIKKVYDFWNNQFLGWSCDCYQTGRFALR